MYHWVTQRMIQMRRCINIRNGRKICYRCTITEQSKIDTDASIVFKIQLRTRIEQCVPLAGTRHAGVLGGY